MKKIYYLMGLLLALVVSGITFVSCSDDDDENGLAPLGTIPTKLKAVDLGLPSGTLWANMDLGATSEKGYGYMFAWGETTPKSELSEFSKDNYKFTVQGSYSRYNNVDNKTELDPEDDAAYVNWGKEWRMPTMEQMEELCTKCTWGREKGAFKVKGPNGNSILIPDLVRYGENSFTQNKLWTRTRYNKIDEYTQFAYGCSCSASDPAVITRARYNWGCVRPVRNQ